MIPAFANVFVFCSAVTRATISPDPPGGWWYTKRNASAVSQMSAPDPEMVNVPPENVALPGRPAAPTSVVAHGAGRFCASTLPAPPRPIEHDKAIDFHIAATRFFGMVRYSAGKDCRGARATAAPRPAPRLPWDQLV